MKKEKLKSFKLNKAIITKMNTTDILKINGGEDDGLRRTILGYRCQQN